MRKNYFKLLLFLWVLLLPLGIIKGQRILFEEGFEDGIPDLWEQDIEYGTVKWEIESESDGPLRFPNGTNSGDKRVIFKGSAGIPAKTKLIIDEQDIEHLHYPVLRFHYAMQELSAVKQIDTLRIYHRGDSQDTWKFLQEYSVNESFWKKAEINLENIGSRTFQIAFEGSSGGGRGIVLDDIMIYEGIDCRTPSDIIVTYLTSYSATLSWPHLGSFATYHYILSENPLPDPENSGEEIETISIATKLFNNTLTPGTTYYFYVRSVCSDGTKSEWSEAVSFTTGCSAVSELNESFEDYSAGANQTPGCWSTFTIGPDDVPKISNANSYVYAMANSTPHYIKSGTKSFYLNATYSSATNYQDAMLVTPMLDNSIDLKDMQLNFWVNFPTLHHRLIVGVCDSYNGENAREVAILGPETTNEHENKIVHFKNSTLNGKYIYFRITSRERLESNTAVYLDDIKLELIPDDCESLKIYHSTSNTTSNSANITWDAVNATRWNVKVSTTRIDPSRDYGNVYDGDVNSNQLALSDLSSGKPYLYYIQPICNQGGTGIWSQEQKFITLCNNSGITKFPHEENFDYWEPYANHSSRGMSVPGCWTHIGNYSTWYNSPYLSTTNSYSGTTSLYFANSSSGYSLGKTPKMGVELNKLQIRFKLAASSSANRQLILGVQSNDAPNRNNITTIETITFNHTDWREYTVTLENTKEEDGRYIVFYAPVSSETYGAFYLDDVVVEYIPECNIVPADFTVTQKTATSVTLSWNTGDNEESWDIVYGLSGFSVEDPDNTILNTAQTNQDIDNLSPGLSYDFYIRSKCSDGIGRWISILNYSMPSSAASPPYRTNFADKADNLQWTFMNINSYNTAYTNKWRIGTNSSLDGNNALYVSFDEHSNQYTATDTYIFAYRDIEFSEAANYDVSFKWRAEGTTTVAFFRAFLVPDNVAISAGSANGISATATPTGWISLGGCFNLSSEWTLFEDIASIVETGKYKLLFYWRNSTTAADQPAAAITDISIKQNEGCIPPQDVSIIKINDKYATISFIDFNSSQWKLKVSSTEIEMDDIDDVTADKYDDIIESTSFLIPDLDPEATYYYYLKAVCETEWNVNGQFTTKCARVLPPLEEGFEGYGTSSGVNSSYPPCWTRFGNYSTSTTYPHIHSSNKYAGSASLYFYNSSTSYNYAILPRMDVDDVRKLKVSFWARVSSLDAVITVGIMEDPDDIYTFVPIESPPLTATNTFQYFEIDIDRGNYTGDSKYIAFKVISNNYTSNANIDNLKVDYLPECREPKNPGISDLTHATAKLFWEGHDGYPKYRVKISETPINPTDEGITPLRDVPVTDEFYEADGLKPNTKYYWYVQSVCSDELSSAWTKEQSFITECVPYEMPFYENFDSWPTGSGNIPDCWTILKGASNVYVNSGSTSICSSPNSLQIRNDGMIATPEIKVGRIQEVALKFNYTSNNSATSPLIVGVIEDLNDMETYEELHTIPGHSGFGCVSHTVDFLSYKGNGKYIVLSGLSSSAVVYVDDVEIKYGTIPCPFPTNPTMYQVSSNTASIQWGVSAYPYPDSYRIKISTYPIDPRTEDGDLDVIEDIEKTYHTIPNLLPQQTYYVYVQSVCSDDDNYNYWTEEISFTTICAAEPLTFSEDFTGYGTGTGAFPPCFKYQIYKNGNVSATYSAAPYINSDNTLLINAERAVSFSGVVSYSAKYIITPELGIDDLRDVQMTFKFRSSTNRDVVLEVGYMTDWAEQSSFKPYETFNTGGVTTFQKFLVNFKEVVEDDKDARFIAFRLHGGELGFSATGYLDDIIIMETPDCAPPYKVRNTNVSDTSLDFEWAAGDDTHSSWSYILTDTEVDLTAPDYASKLEQYKKGWGTTTTPSCSIGNLTGLTTYYFYVANSVCDEYYPVGIKATTNCGLMEIPYFDNFSSYSTSGSGINSAFPTCWSRIYDPTFESSVYPNLTVYEYGPTVLNAYGPFTDKGTSFSVSVMPEAKTDDISKLRARFKALRPGNTIEQTSIYVGIMTNPEDTATFIGLDTITLKEQHVWYTITVPFTEYQKYGKDGKHIAFFSKLVKGTSSQPYGIMITDLHIEEIPPCDGPIYFTQIGYTETTAKIKWNNVDDSFDSWEVVYGPKGFNPDNYASTPGAASVTADDSIFTVPGLQPNSIYEAYVRAVCNGGHSIWSEKIFMYTAQDDRVNTLPYYTEFNNADDANWTLLNGDQVNHWIFSSLSTTETGRTDDLYKPVNGYALLISNDGIKYEYNIGAKSNSIAFRTVDLPAGIYDFRTRVAKRGGADDYVRTALIPDTIFLQPESNNGMSSNSTIPPGWINIGVKSSSTLFGEVYNSKYELTKEMAGRYKLAYVWTNRGYTGNGSQGPAAIDWVKVDTITCPVPQYLRAINVQETSVELDWVGYNAGEWDVKVSTVQLTGNIEEQTGDKFNETVTATPVPVSGLEIGTEYYYYVKSDCNDTWVERTFMTKCEPQAFPLVEDFDNYGSGVSSYVSCWTKINELSTSNYPYLSTDAKSSGTASLLFRSSSTTKAADVVKDIDKTAGGYCVSVSPELNVEDMSRVHLSFRARKYSTSSGNESMIVLGVMGDPNDFGTFTPLDTIRPANATFTLFSFELSDYTFDIDKKHLAFLCPQIGTSNGAYIDDLRIGCWEEHFPKDYVCLGYPYRANGFDFDDDKFTTTGDHLLERRSLSDNGCDSIILLDLSVLQDYTRIEASICQGETYNEGLFQGLTEGDVYIRGFESILSGCDSIVELHLTVNPTYEFIEPITYCEELLPYTWRGKQYNASGTYYDSFKTEHTECDSVYVLELVVLKKLEEVYLPISICKGEEYIFKDQVYTESIVKTEIFESVLGCDSMVTLDLTVNEVYDLHEDVEICVGASYTGYGFEDLTVADSYTTGLTESIHGCDSMFTLHLFVSDRILNAVRDTICNGEEYEFGGDIYTKPVVVTKTFESVLYGCDSVVTLTLTVLDTYEDDDYLTINEKDLPRSYGDEIIPEGTKTGVITYDFTTIYGCDSTVHLHLTVNPNGTNLPLYSEDAFFLIPNPVKLGEKVYVNYEFSAEELNGLQIEVFNMSGNRISISRLDGYPINIGDYIESTGVYMIKVTTGTNKIMTGKLIVI